MMIRKTALLSVAVAAFLGLSLSAQAQKLSGLKVEPAKAEVAQSVKATTAFEVTNNNINCRVRVNWGDGQSVDVNINQEKDVPLVQEHSYAKPGKYDVRVEGKGGTKCLGEDQHAALEITPKAAKAAKPAASAAAVAAAPVCPKGWKLSKAGVSKKTGAFTCSAKAKTAIPEPKLTCPTGLTYFDDAKKVTLGCKA
jgi:hypothetical protein